jgi:hypothetical protein
VTFARKLPHCSLWGLRLFDRRTHRPNPRVRRSRACDVPPSSNEVRDPPKLF